ncbi:3',5'-cyclic-AMP phosphodiesterase [Vibrio ulleungensis]|uniref:3',5'-cyclic adenosine monophosphate phosphodiesterase CpdA n=1 Tax=Vibrio ulleungensis TaxID=2807619 RepID=A0ABS2HIU9_9VIBR|nr:3',5'-cyclic-AMP phosphodiesterase [Vibrio ulleungensis]MBM7037453.1 3',5'-cyclic-AMP phosphodiesterase [Vibrio ulleungensis]
MSQHVAPSKDRVELVQITDTHLFEPADGNLLSVNTEQSFHAVVQNVIDSQCAFDAVLATGDISQDHTPASYEKFVQGIRPLVKQCYWLPGNHDYKPSMGSVIPTDQIVEDTHVMIGKHWQLILLDSQVVGVPYGELSQQQLAMLDQCLSQHPDKHSLVLLHHHPVLIGSAWLDQHTLRNSSELWEVINRHSNVKGLLCGHVHQDFDQLHSGVRVIATPSTCAQFKPNSNDFALDNVAPGWRRLSLLENGQIETHVHRLEAGRFVPDFDAEGY